MSQRDRDRIEAVLSDTTINAALGWMLVGILIATVAVHILAGSRRWGLFTALVMVVILWPAIDHRDPRVMPPWYLIAVFLLPVVAEAAAPGVYDLMIYIGVATAVLLLAVELHRLTPLALSPTVAVVMVVLTTLAAAALWNMLLWGVDVLFDTTFLLDGRDVDTINDELMFEFATATGVGVLAGIAFEWAFRRRWLPTVDIPAPAPVQPPELKTPPPTLAERIGLSPTRQRQLTKSMQVILGAIILIGLFSKHVPTVVNAAIALAITFLPAAVEREFDVHLDVGLTLWLTTAVFLHALGSAGLYDFLGPWDNLTHVVSASVVAGAGYTVMRAIQVHDPEVHFPDTLLPAIILVFVLAMGVMWELLEFMADTIAVTVEIESVLAQHGIHDTIVDLWFNALGGLIVVIWGTVYLLQVSDELADWLYAYRQK